jgi:hypothetical protein
MGRRWDVEEARRNAQSAKHILYSKFQQFYDSIVLLPSLKISNYFYWCTSRRFIHFQTKVKFRNMAHFLVSILWKKQDFLELYDMRLHPPANQIIWWAFLIIINEVHPVLKKSLIPCPKNSQRIIFASNCSCTHYRFKYFYVWAGLMLSYPKSDEVCGGWNDALALTWRQKTTLFA